MSRLLSDHLTTLPPGASRRRFLRSVAGALGVVTVGLGVRAGEAKDTDAGNRASLDQTSRRRPSRRPALRPRKLRDFNVRSTHAVTQAAETGCDNPGGLCTTTFGGTGNASHLGGVTYRSSLTSDWSQAVDTAPEGRCAPTTGNATLRSISKDKDKRGSVVLELRGTVCETKGDGQRYPLVFDGVYKIVDGTGNYTKAKGNGQADGAVQGGRTGGVASFVAKGKILL